MWGDIVALVNYHAMGVARRAVAPAAIALFATACVLVAVVGVFSAFFFWLESTHGPVVAALVVAAVAFVSCLIALLPVLLARRRKAPAPTSPINSLASTIPEIVPLLGSRQIVIAAILLGLTVAVKSRSSTRDER